MNCAKGLQLCQEKRSQKQWKKTTVEGVSLWQAINTTTPACRGNKINYTAPFLPADGISFSGMVETMGPNYQPYCPEPRGNGGADDKRYKKRDENIKE